MKSKESFLQNKTASTKPSKEEVKKAAEKAVKRYHDVLKVLEQR